MYSWLKLQYTMESSGSPYWERVVTTIVRGTSSPVAALLLIYKYKTDVRREGHHILTAIPTPLHIPSLFELHVCHAVPYTWVVASPLLTVKLLMVTWIWPWLIMLMMASAAVFMGMTGIERAPLPSVVSWPSHFI